MAGALVATWLSFLVRRLRPPRPDFHIGLPLLVGASARIVAVVALSALAPTARGPDEGYFLKEAHVLADLPLNAAENVTALTSTFQIWLFALELRIDFPELAMRFLQVGFALTGLVLIAAAVHDLAGARASRIAAWLVMLEPSSLFFSGLLHKEPFMVLGAGIVVFGGTMLWTRRDLRGVAIMVAGAAITLMARPYAGGLLAAGVLMICVHGAMTRRGPLQRRSLALAAFLIVVLIAATPTVLEKTSDERLASKLQISQIANTTDSSNLRLEPVDFSSRAKVLQNLPRRMRDVVLRPYPWQLGSVNQRAGFPGTLSALGAFVFLVLMAVRSRGRIFEHAGPLIYAAGSLFLAFSLASGNAGTSFRLRSTVVVLTLCIVVVLHQRRTQAHEARSSAQPRGPRVQAPTVLSGAGRGA